MIRHTVVGQCRLFRPVDASAGDDDESDCKGRHMSARPRRSFRRHTNAAKGSAVGNDEPARAPSVPASDGPMRPVRRRPTWHRGVGWLGVVAAGLVIVLNELMRFDSTVVFLPGGHRELYLVLGLVTAGGASWFLGLFDRGTTVYE